MVKKITQTEIDDYAIKIVRDEKTRWQDAVCFVTEKVAFHMRFLIRQLRKNYWGIFDMPFDQTTQRAKTWIPLTQSLVENVVKTVDLDTKDIGFTAKNPRGYEFTDITRAIVKDYLDKIYFGEKLDEMERTLATDGTVVWKTIEGEKGKAIIKNVDLLNVYIDPTEDNIQNAYRFTERGLLLPSEVEAMTGWRNTKDVIGSTGLARIDSSYRTISAGTTAYFVDVWEMWGKIPKWLVTAQNGDEEEIDGHIVISGLETGDVRVHLIEENTNGVKPYEECRYSKVTNRWYGVGVAEKVLALQIWLNTIVNIRINRSYISQLGLFKIRKGSGITPAMLSRLSANGAIVVNDMGDIESFQMDDASEASYKDEQVILDWSQKLTSAYDAAVGEATPASMSATANILQDRNAKSQFTMIKEAMGSFLQRWMDRHALPIIINSVKIGDLVRFTPDDETYKDLVQKIVAYEAQTELDDVYSKGYIPTAQQMIDEIQRAEEKLHKNGMFVKVTKSILTEHLETRVSITNEDLDISVTIQNLMTMLPLAPEYKDSIVKEVYDLMGLSQPKASLAQNQQAQNPQPMQGQASANLQGINTRANIPQTNV